MPDFLLHALLAGLALALVAGPLGSFVVWRRMAYFGDTLSHAALFGVALGLMLDVNLTLAVTVGCVLLALLLVTLQQRQPLASDTLLGILAHSTLSLGLVSLSFMDDVRIDLMGYLFGDLLAVGSADLAWIVGGSALVLLLLVPLWRPLLAITVHEELARVEGLPVAAIRLALMLLIAVIIAVAMKIVGVLLITSLLIIPAAAAQRHAPDPRADGAGRQRAGHRRSVPGVDAVLVRRHSGRPVHRGQRRRVVPAQLRLAEARMTDLKYLRGYPEPLLAQVRQLIAEGRLGDYLQRRYPGRHQVQSDKALYGYVQTLKQEYLKSAPPIDKVLYDNRLDLTHRALGLHTAVSRVQGGKLKAKKEIRVAALFREAAPEFLQMIVVHELAHLRESEHNRAFYKLCEHMLPGYGQIEFDLRLFLHWRELQDR